jgi:hypothetical protein
VRVTDWKLLRKLQGGTKPGKASWKEAALQMAAVPLLSALLGYGVGVLTAQREQETYERRLYLEQRMKLFVSTTANFSGYLENHERLVTFVSHKMQTGGLKERRDLDQRTKYFQDRDAARDRLWADLDQAQLLFGADVVRPIGDFRSFFEQHRLGTVDTLPAKAEYVKRKDAILIAMRDAIRGGRP